MESPPLYIGHAQCQFKQSTLTEQTMEVNKFGTYGIKHYIALTYFTKCFGILLTLYPVQKDLTYKFFENLYFLVVDGCRV